MGLVDRRLAQVNRGIDGGPVHSNGQIFPEIRAIRADVNADGHRSVRLYSDDYWLPVDDPANDESLVWASPSEKTVTLTYDTQDHLSTIVPTPIDRYGEPDEHTDPIGIYSEHRTTIVSAPMSCIEYAASEDPDDVVRVHCVETKSVGAQDSVLRLALEHHHPEIVEAELRERLGDEAVETIRRYVDEVIDTVPDVVYHKCSIETLVSTLKEGRYQKESLGTDGGPPSIVKHRNMSASDIHMPSRRLKTPWPNQRVTIKMRVPEDTCPLRMVYDLPAGYRHNNWYIDSHVIYQDVEAALIDVYYTIKMKEALRMKYPGCRRVGEDDIERKGKHDSYSHEREIFIIPGDGETIAIRDDDILEIIAEGECGASQDLVKAALRDSGLDHMIGKVTESEFCAIASDVISQEWRERGEWNAETQPWEWNDRLGHIHTHRRY